MTPLAKHESEIGERLSLFIKAELKRGNLTYNDLAERLARHGIRNETVDSIKAKLKRGSFSATFLIAVLAALDKEGIDLKDL